MTVKVKTLTAENGKKFHIISGLNIECSGQDCVFCNGETEISFHDWERSVPYPIPPKGKRYKNPLAQKNRGKTIMEICYTCKDIPCYICRRTKCEKWMKEEAYKGQEKGCPYWENGRCLSFQCKRGIIKTHWRDAYGIRKS